MAEANIPRRVTYDVPAMMERRRVADQQAGYQNAMIGLQDKQETRLQETADRARDSELLENDRQQVGRVMSGISKMPPEQQVQVWGRLAQDSQFGEIMGRHPQLQSLLPDPSVFANPATVQQGTDAVSRYFGVMPPSPQGSPSDFMQKYNEARAQGFQGTLLDFQKQWTAASQGPGGSDARPYYTPVYTPEGVSAFDNRAGTLSAIAPGVRRTADDPGVRGAVAGAQETGKAVGAAVGKAQVDLPKTIDQAEATIGHIDEILDHPAFKSAVGATLKPFVRFIEGSPEADFMLKLGQVQDAAFLQAFQDLKGGGHITEIEGIKATRAISRMNKGASEDEFRRAAEDYKDVVRKGVVRALKLASGAGGQVADQFVVGKVYEDANGNKAVYLGNGRWEQK